MQNILITGGLGYIGSHTATLLIQRNYNVTIIDNLSNSDISVLEKITLVAGTAPKFIQCDLTSVEAVEDIFKHDTFDAVIHFAGCKVVSESIMYPIPYYLNNVAGTINLVSAMSAHNVKTLIFSSSAAVYGDAVAPICEQHAKNPTSVYGKTKSYIEDILYDIQLADKDWRIICLRYFNPAGAHSSGILGDCRPINLISNICKVASGEQLVLKIFGTDYNTVDGSAIRDYIHVVDLAEGHIAVLQQLTVPAYVVLNIGTGCGVTVKQLVSTFEKSTGNQIPCMEASRLVGDIAVSYANTDKIKQEVEWSATHTIEQMCVDSWRWYVRN